MMPKTKTDDDPLADLRDLGGAEQTMTAEGVPGPLVPGVTPEMDEDQAVSAIVVRWHADATAQSFGHGGGTCGCAYLARKAVQAIRV